MLLKNVHCDIEVRNKLFFLIFSSFLKEKNCDCIYLLNFSTCARNLRALIEKKNVPLYTMLSAIIKNGKIANACDDMEEVSSTLITDMRGIYCTMI